MNARPDSAGKPVASTAWTLGSTLFSGTYRSPQYDTENEVLSDLARRMVESPGTILACLCEASMRLIEPGSAGVSILEDDGLFHWRATAGAFAAHLNGTMPAERSPCGVVLRENATLEMPDPVRSFPEIADLCAPVSDLLLAPFHRNGTPVGTVWVVAHAPDKRFDQEDVRLLTSISGFASAASELVENQIRLTREAEAGVRALEEAAELRAAVSAVNERQVLAFATLAHELRNPLGAIANAVAVLERGNSEDGQRAREIAHRQLTHMRHLLDDLLDAARPEHGTAIATACVDMRSIIRDAVEMMAGEFERRGQDLSVSLPQKAIFVLGNATHLAQVTTNLLTNAAKYAASAGRIGVTLTQDADEAVLQVTDNGIGIASDMLPAIFRMFVQVDKAIGGPDRGLGVGLAVVSRLVDKAGGSVVASSPGLGQGSTFTVRLPVSRTH